MAGALLAMSRGIVYSGSVVSRLEQHSAALAPVEGVKKKLLCFDCAKECILQQTGISIKPAPHKGGDRGSTSESMLGLFAAVNWPRSVIFSCILAFVNTLLGK